jgi:Domain of unknown function (DUF4352)
VSEDKQNQTKSKKGILKKIGYGFLALLTVSTIASSFEFVPTYQIILAVLPVIALPYGVRYIFKRDLKTPYPFARIMGVLIVVMLFVQSANHNTLAYSEYQARRAKVANQEAETKQAEAAQEEQEATQKTVEASHYIGDAFKTGYMLYQVDSIQWRKRIGNEYFGDEADARYLLVHIQIKNEDKETRLIPPFKLIDESGATYEESVDRIGLKGGLLLKKLNPGVSTKATLLFDVPPNHHYKLQVDGGYWSNDKALVVLN